ncbi:LacI family transcriptional regulator [Microbacterium nanhaiense]|uniref:LacI family transcriptional regulator n=2 Tax=Microbacterium nanhaiense TaxID=1301026 RepID=A0ABQ2MYX5_9MICO|nr:LacI family transcriptional regulator [Microbacterium nanhaiense]
MADVAAAAGVSHQTVSRVLNGHSYVREATRDRVLAAIDELGYRRNQAARTLATSRSATVGIVATDTAHFGPSSTVLAVEQAARDAGRFVSIASVASDDPGAAIEQLMAQGVDGIVVVAPHVEVARLLDAAPARIPIVVVAARSDAPRDTAIRYVAVDQAAGAAAVAEHFAGLGHRGFAHIGGPDDWFDAIERSRGFAERARRLGGAVRILPAGGWGARQGYDAARALVTEIAERRVTAVFAANDYLAIGAIRAFADAGLRVPGDVSVVGFDDVEGAAYLAPALATVQQPFATLGKAAVAALDPDDPEPRILPTLIARESTSRPPG